MIRIERVHYVELSNKARRALENQGPAKYHISIDVDVFILSVVIDLWWTGFEMTKGGTHPQSGEMENIVLVKYSSCVEGFAIINENCIEEETDFDPKKLEELING